MSNLAYVDMGADSSSTQRNRLPDGEDPEPKSRKRRRVLACETCRRIKSRCDFNRAAGSCNRCKNLRITCSLTGSEVGHYGQNVEVEEAPDTQTTLIRDLHAKISEQGVILQELKQMVEGNLSPSVSSQRNFSVTGNTPVVSPATKDEADNAKAAADRDTESAPVIVIRNAVRMAQDVPQRLTNRGIRNLLNMGIFSHETIIELLHLFLSRSGKWIQVVSWESMNINPDLETIPTLLLATCALQGLRLSQLRDTELHLHLYEYVRSVLAPSLLISPLPMEYLQPLTIMALWNMAPNINPNPQKKIDFIDTWLLSGQCVQHAMLTINFTDILTRIKQGQSNFNDRLALRLWNTICVSHLFFAVGTGRPSIIAKPYLAQCPSILDVLDPSLEDKIVLAEINLYSILLKLLKFSAPLELNGSCREIEIWYDEWGHLMEAKVDRVLICRMNYHFAYLVIAQRSLKMVTENHTKAGITAGSNPSAPTVEVNTSTVLQSLERRQYISISIEHATKLLGIMQRLPPTLSKSQPDSLTLSILYAMVVLVACYDESLDKENTIKTARDALSYCKRAGVEPMVAAEFALASLDRRRQMEVNPGTEVQNQMSAGDVYDDFNGLTGLEFPSLEGLFNESFVTGGFEDDWMNNPNTL